LSGNAEAGALLAGLVIIQRPSARGLRWRGEPTFTCPAGVEVCIAKVAGTRSILGQALNNRADEAALSDQSLTLHVSRITASTRTVSLVFSGGSG
jgi:hypothetical protein